MAAPTNSHYQRSVRVALGGCCAVLLLLSVGCSRHLMNVALRTPVSVRLDTPVEMTTDVVTRMPADNRVSAIVGRPIPLAAGAGSSAETTQIAVVDVDGLIVNRNLSGIGSMGENPVALFREKLNAVASDSRVRAVILRINSPGGGVTASDIMRRDLTRFREQTGMPVVACLMDTGAGGAYYLATACDAIVAHPTSVVGGIGVILNLYNVEDTMAQFNILSTAIRAGDQIDAGSPVRQLAKEERSMLQEIADDFHQRFHRTVLQSRDRYAGDPKTDFDGSVFTATTAMNKGLIDQIGYIEDATTIASSLAKCARPNQLLLYRRDNDRARTPYDVTPNIPLQHSVFPLSLPGLDRSQMPTFLYLWQIEPTIEKSGA